MTHLDSILKSRDITLPTKVHWAKAMVFPVVMYGCESWTIKKSWAPKNWWFWTVVLEKTLESPLECTEIQPVHPKGNQSWIFVGRTDVEVETPIYAHLMQRTDSLEKILMLGKIEGRKRGGWQRKRWLDGITDSMDISLSNRELAVDWKACHAVVHWVSKSQKRLSDWTELALLWSKYLWIFLWALLIADIYKLNHVVGFLKYSLSPFNSWHNFFKAFLKRQMQFFIFFGGGVTVV